MTAFRRRRKLAQCAACKPGRAGSADGFQLGLIDRPAFLDGLGQNLAGRDLAQRLDAEGFGGGFLAHGRDGIGGFDLFAAFRRFRGIADGTMRYQVGLAYKTKREVDGDAGVVFFDGSGGGRSG